MAFALDQGRTSIEPDAQLARGVLVGKARIAPQVRHKRDAVAADGVVAQRHLARHLARLDAHARLEPLALAIDEADQRDRHAEEQRGAGYHPVARWLRLPVEYVQTGIAAAPPP